MIRAVRSILSLNRAKEVAILTRFLGHPKVLFPLFPFFLSGCRLADALGFGGRTSGQILVGRAWKR